MSPSVAALTRRLADTPVDFRADPASVDVPALVGDVLRTHGGPPLTEATARPWTSGPANRLALVLLACWLADDPSLVAPGSAGHLHALLADGLTDLAELLPAGHFVTDPDRREELVRVTLRGLRLLPAGESAAAAADRLAAVDTVRRHTVLREAEAAERRAAEIREALARKRAEESAARYSQV